MGEAGLSLEQASERFAALGDPLRLSLIEQLLDGQPRSIRSLSANRAISRQAITKHLLVLEDAGMVSSSKLGRERQFSCQPGAIDQTRQYLDQVAATWDATLGRLQRHLQDASQ